MSSGWSHEAQVMDSRVYDTNNDGTVNAADVATVASGVDEDPGAGPPSGTGTEGRPYYDTTNDKRYLPQPDDLTTWDLVSG